MQKEKFEVSALTFEYFGVARKELEAAASLARAAGVDEHRLFRLPDLREAEDIGGSKFGGMPGTYIPGRNGIFYSIAASYAEEMGAGLVLGGHNRDDRRAFKDARPVFFRSLERALRLGSRSSRDSVRIGLPLTGMTKTSVVRLAAETGVPLALTWSCHRDGQEHCWECEGCVSREGAFKKAGVRDPLRETGKIT